MQIRHPMRYIHPYLMTVVATTAAILLATSNPAVAKTGIWASDWNNKNLTLERVAECIVVTHQNTNKTNSKLTKYTKPNSSEKEPKWDDNTLFKYNTGMYRVHNTKKGSDGCQNMPKKSEYVKCVFIQPSNIVVTVSEQSQAELRSETASWSLIKLVTY